MKRTRIDSRIEIWSINWVNDPDIRNREGLVIEQIEAVNDRWYIVEIYQERGEE